MSKSDTQKINFPEDNRPPQSMAIRPAPELPADAWKYSFDHRTSAEKEESLQRMEANRISNAQAKARKDAIANRKDAEESNRRWLAQNPEIAQRLEAEQKEKKDRSNQRWNSFFLAIAAMYCLYKGHYAYAVGIVGIKLIYEAIMRLGDKK